jgi:hypothetical protein
MDLRDDADEDIIFDVRMLSVDVDSDDDARDLI